MMNNCYDWLMWGFKVKIIIFEQNHFFKYVWLKLCLIITAFQSNIIWVKHPNFSWESKKVFLIWIVEITRVEHTTFIQCATFLQLVQNLDNTLLDSKIKPKNISKNILYLECSEKVLWVYNWFCIEQPWPKQYVEQCFSTWVPQKCSAIRFYQYKT
jgi:hypothetical protein